METETEPGPAASTAPSTWQRMRTWAVAHAVDDFYQGLVPAAVPYFVLDRGLSYVAASGLATAATVGSALPQLVLGVLADRYRLVWMAPAGVALAGVGAGLAGVLPSYWMVLVALLVSGLGVAMFHPSAGRDARRASGGTASAMSVFATGGKVGFFLAPALVTPALDAGGLGATALFIPPALLAGFVLLRHARRTAQLPAGAGPAAGPDRWGMFGLLTVVEVVRSGVAFGINTFVSLYWVRDLGASPVLGGTALTLVLGGSVLGTLAGGRIADRAGLVRTVRLGNALALPATVAMLLVGDAYAALPLALLVGVVTAVPFSVLVKLGQDYLPARPGTAAGVTLGLAVSAGGLFVPVLGAVADAHGPQGALAVLAVLPVLAAALSLGLREPAPSP